MKVCHILIEETKLILIQMLTYSVSVMTVQNEQQKISFTGVMLVQSIWHTYVGNLKNDELIFSNIQFKISVDFLNTVQMPLWDNF